MIESDEFTPFFGFTENEVKELCIKYGMDYEEGKEWYNGYSISDQHMYNPNSVYRCMVRHKLDSYWKNTSAFDGINQFISYGFDGLKDDILSMLHGEKIPVNVQTFQNDLSIIRSKDDVFTALIHLGYLGYDILRKKVYIPNYNDENSLSCAITMAYFTAPAYYRVIRELPTGKGFAIKM